MGRAEQYALKRRREALATLKNRMHEVQGAVPFARSLGLKLSRVQKKFLMETSATRALTLASDVKRRRTLAILAVWRIIERFEDVEGFKLLTTSPPLFETIKALMEDLTGRALSTDNHNVWLGSSRAMLLPDRQVNFRFRVEWLIVDHLDDLAPETLEELIESADTVIRGLSTEAR